MKSLVPLSEGVSLGEPLCLGYGRLRLGEPVTVLRPVFESVIT